mmetsp:Transcript_959/g.3168  ORF Transcript_959/g.3168 Transcript_959/m.3168 type:complete len:401 (-) Transcript_959:44-1246(-)
MLSNIRWNPFDLCADPSPAANRVLRELLDNVREDMEERINKIEGTVSQCQEKVDKNADDMLDLRARLLTGDDDQGAQKAAALTSEVMVELQQLAELREEVRGLRGRSTRNASLQEEIEEARMVLQELNGMEEIKNRVVFVPLGVASEDLSIELDAAKAKVEEAKPQANYGKDSSNETQLRQFKAYARAQQEMLTKLTMMVSCLQQEFRLVRAEVALLQSMDRRVEETVHEVKEDMRRAAEVNAIKAGRLAVAVGGSNEAERKLILAKLDERERRLLSGADGGHDDDHLAEDMDRSAVVDGAGRAEEEGDPSGREFALELDLSDGRELGLDIAEAGTCLQIVKISAGAVKEHNEAPEAIHMLQVGNSIVQVNDVRGHPALMKRELLKKKPLRLMVVTEGGG